MSSEKDDNFNFEKLKDEIKWSSDEELESLTSGLLQNDGFLDAVCVVDGSEIKIS